MVTENPLTSALSNINIVGVGDTISTTIIVIRKNKVS